jgi:ATP-binding cassette subfamily C (CFTR/MRP) protein 1
LTRLQAGKLITLVPRPGRASTNLDPSVDAVTESLMQDVVDNDFFAQTVLAVVHRLRFIERFDKVAVLDKGILVEFDTPAALLGRKSVLSEMSRAGNGAEAVLSSNSV